MGFSIIASHHSNRIANKQTKCFPRNYACTLSPTINGKHKLSVIEYDWWCSSTAKMCIPHKHRRMHASHHLTTTTIQLVLFHYKNIKTHNLELPITWTCKNLWSLVIVLQTRTFTVLYLLYCNVVTFKRLYHWIDREALQYSGRATDGAKTKYSDLASGLWKETFGNVKQFRKFYLNVKLLMYSWALYFTVLYVHMHNKTTNRIF